MIRSGDPNWSALFAEIPFDRWLGCASPPGGSGVSGLPEAALLMVRIVQRASLHSTIMAQLQIPFMDLGRRSFRFQMIACRDVRTSGVSDGI
jgi:hypothetical protein